MLRNGGMLQPACRSGPELDECNAFGAQLAAALNRGVAHAPPQWLDPAAFYQRSPRNDWAPFWHAVSIDGLAYGMDYDDTADQSSVVILPAEEHPGQVTIGIGW